MPYGIQRLNSKKSQPNARIVFIKTLKGPDEAIAQDYLERVAAQCFPIMREHGIDVMSLEEFPPNRQFVGRNFNAGEVVQLVLKSLSGRWLPFDFVQMVMMHELAHCKQMNHSRAFWAVRNGYAAQMRELWSRGYTGEGLWGRGAKLGTGEWDKNTVRADEPIPEHLCGGTYRTQRKRRKTTKQPALTSKERRERRILKKFGAHGVALGADDDVKSRLEGGRAVKSRPKVAGSVRGRELRAAAALARLADKRDGSGKEEEVEEEAEEEVEDLCSDSDSDYEAVIDVDGRQLVDRDGRGLVRICGEGGGEDTAGAEGEFDELRDMLGARRHVERQGIKGNDPAGQDFQPRPIHIKEGEDSDGQDCHDGPIHTEDSQESTARASERCCSMCSFANAGQATTCTMCANVLNPAEMPNAWRCAGESCRETEYMNAGDCGVCGLCGERPL